MWGDSAMAARQLVQGGDLHYLIGDYLAETTMAILAAQMKKDPQQGYARDWVSATMAPLLKDIRRKNIKVITNAGGLNPHACQKALLKVAAKLNISDLKVAVVLGDDLKSRASEFHLQNIREMWSGASFPDPVKILSVNCYLGARPIAEALSRGAEVVITGRVVDSALCLAPLLYEHGWTDSDYSLLSAGSLAGHLIECGAQGTGGLFTDWKIAAKDWHNMGYPIVEVAANGEFILTKVVGTGGTVCPAAAAEQLVYEIGDPARYELPDVSCDWTGVTITTAGLDKVLVRGARGNPPSSNLKLFCTYMDGYKLALIFCIVGEEAAAKGQATATALLTRADALLKTAKLSPYTEQLVEVFGSETSFGAHATNKLPTHAREVVVKIGVRHSNPKALKLLANEVASSFVSMSPGTFGLLGGRPSPLPVIAGFSALLPKHFVNQSVVTNFHPEFKVAWPVSTPLLVGTVPGGPPGGDISKSLAVATAIDPLEAGDSVTKVPLIQLCYGRSGDKGPSVNIGIVAREPQYLPYLRHQLTAEAVQKHFQHRSKGRALRFDLPGINGMNFLLEDALRGGGMFTLQSDALGKAYAQILLSSFYVDVPSRLLLGLNQPSKL
eukprot:gb/GEZN01004445.1/.p1 GENE.gb/GEZN01004445.1/~~gb/GEZN01004445.1/.p1  ORF type:complete len:646 (+),score=71.24 gb/GEZN01004445.1/:108-1940(+)